MKASRTEEDILHNKWLHYPAAFFNLFFRYPYSPFLVQLVVTRRCNLKCGYCSEFDNHSESVPVARLMKTIDKIKKLHTYSLTFTGGEPLLHPDLTNLIRAASRAIPHVGLITNGFLLNREKIEQFNQAGLKRLQISLDGVKQTEITKKVLNNTKEKLHLLAGHAKFTVNINACLGSTAIEETLTIVSYARNLGFETTVQWLHDVKGHALQPFPIEEEDIRRIARAEKLPFLYSKKIVRAGLLSTKPWKCRAGSRYLYIDELSRARFCAQARKIWQCEIDDLDYETLRKNFHTPKPCSPGCTIGCVRNVSRYDFWRKQ